MVWELVPGWLFFQFFIPNQIEETERLEYFGKSGLRWGIYFPGAFQVPVGDGNHLADRVRGEFKVKFLVPKTPHVERYVPVHEAPKAFEEEEVFFIGGQRIVLADAVLVECDGGQLLCPHAFSNR